MKVSFILGKYSPGKCGISDYVTLMGNALEAKGVANEKLSIANSNGLSFSELSKKIPVTDLLSLQFAPFSFSKNGTSGTALMKFGKAISERNSQLYFHEIWVGAYPGASLLERLKGWRQKKEILRFIKIAKPSMIMSSNAAAIDRLTKEGVKADHLYLFGNIPFELLHKKPSNKSNDLLVTFFGTIYSDFPFVMLSKVLHELSEISIKPILIQILGRHRESKGLNLLLLEAKKKGFRVEVTGAVHSSEVSCLLQDSDIGVCTTPYDAIGKSGATAAMLEHGLPVLSYDDGDTPIESLFIFTPFEDQLFLLNDDNCAYHLRKFMNRPRKPFFDGVEYTTNKILDHIY